MITVLEIFTKFVLREIWSKF